jgi:AraC-like DNA-binding protein
MTLKLVIAGRSSNASRWMKSFSLNYSHARIYRMVTGTIKIESNGKKIILTSPGLYWVPPMVNSINTAMTDFSSDWLQYTSEDLELNTQMLNTPFVSFPLEVHNYWLPEWDDVLNTNSRYFVKSEGLNGLISSIHYRVFKQKPKKTDTALRHIVEPAIDLLGHKSETRPSNKALAEACGISVSYFSRCFKRFSGMTPLDYQKKHLMEKVAHLLHCNHNLSQIYKKVNYPSTFSLSRDFKKQMGVSPREYLKGFKD